MSEDGVSYHEAVAQFKRQMLLETLKAHGGNRTHAARALGLQRTYLLRLLREFAITEPRPMRQSSAMTANARR